MPPVFILTHIYLVNTQLPLNKLSDRQLGGRSRPTNTRVVDHRTGDNKYLLQHCYYTTSQLVTRPAYLVGMSPVLMFGSVGSVAEGLGAAWELAHVGLLPGVRPQVGLQVLQATVGFPTSLELKSLRLLT